VANREKSDARVEHQDVLKEKSTVETLGALKDQYGDWHLAAGCHQQPNKWTQGDGESQKKLAAAHRQKTCCTVPARHTRYDHIGLMFEKR
jgi:hypothetical protein